MPAIFYTLRDLLERGYTGRQVRFALLSTHYRMQLNFTFQVLDAAISALTRFDDFIARLDMISDTGHYGEVDGFLHTAHQKFKAALADDLNISPALAALFDLVRAVNTLCDEGRLGKAEAAMTLNFLRSIDRVLGVLFTKKEEDIPIELQELLVKRNQARADKNWTLADECRILITERGYLIEDTPGGARLKKSGNRV